MRIQEFQIKNFRSIYGAKSKIDTDLTTLIGANESGKTNTLIALSSLDWDYEYLKDDICTFSKEWELKRSKKIRAKDIEMVNVVLDLDDDDKAKLEKIHHDLKDINNIKCKKYWDDSYFFEVDGIDLEKLAENKKNKEIATLILAVEKTLKKYFLEYRQSLTQIDSKDVGDTYREIHEGIVNLLKNNELSNNNRYYSQLNDLFSVSPQMRNNAQNLIQEIESYKLKIEKLKEHEMYFFEDILKLLPNFMYIESYEELKDSYDLKNYIENKEKFKTLNNLFNLVGLDINEVTSLSTTDMQTELGYCSDKLTYDFNQYWNQDKIRLEIHIGKEIAIMIKDDLIKGRQKLSMRSEGLLNALSVFVNLMSLPDYTIVFLDDPGVYLHPSGQKDILKMMDIISESKQIVFSTHSPFMINRDKLDSVKLLYKDKNQGTLIKKAHSSDHDAFAPIRAVIGMNINDLLFNGNKTVMVEGQSDNILLSTMSQLLFKLDKPFIELSEYAIFPVNGATKMVYFSAFFLNQGFNFINVLDYDKQGRNTYKKLKESFNDEIKIICLNEIISNGASDVEIEDLIDFEFYFAALNFAYKSIFQRKLSRDSLDEDKLSIKSFRGIKEFFKSNKSKIGDLDKIMVASKIREMIIDGFNPGEDTITNFSVLFDKINTLSNS